MTNRYHRILFSRHRGTANNDLGVFCNAQPTDIQTSKQIHMKYIMNGSWNKFERGSASSAVLAACYTTLDKYRHTHRPTILILIFFFSCICIYICKYKYKCYSTLDKYRHINRPTIPILIFFFCFCICIYIRKYKYKCYKTLDKYRHTHTFLFSFSFFDFPPLFII